jgi:nucleoside-diphosphate-sugar epimerase
MSSLVVLGAGGFLGRSLVSAAPLPLSIKAVARRVPQDARLDQDGVTWVEADLLLPSALDAVLSPEDIVVNLAYAPAAGEAMNGAMVNNIVEACVSHRVARLVHCSTAVVAGAAARSRILESAHCHPRLPYERTKWALELRVLAAVPKGLDVVVVRPTEIVGRGSRNLVKLARSLQRGNRIANYLRASVLANRPMHLVPVRNVVGALLHLATLPGPMNGNIYHVSADEDPGNRFGTIEVVLSNALGLPSRRLPLLPVSWKMVSLLLGLLGRSAPGSSIFYDSRKLLDTGFRPVDSVASAVREFGEHFRADQSPA